MRKGRRTEHDLLLADQGFGPLLERDYWAVIRNCRATPAQIVETVRRFFPSFSPRELVVFDRSDGSERPLDVGDELEVKITGAGHFRVRVIHRNEQSITVGTEVGHPEAGRITFGAYRNGHGDVIFHIRSHARSSSRFNRTGFRAMGEAMQTSTWTDFVNRVAVAFGEGPIGFIHAETRRCEDEAADQVTHAPTYLAQGG